MSPYSTPLGEAGGLIECRDPNIDALGAIWTPLDVSWAVLSLRHRQATAKCSVNGRVLMDMMSRAIWFECVVEPDSCVAFPRLFGCMPFVACTTPALTPVQQCVLDLVNGTACRFFQAKPAPSIASSPTLATASSLPARPRISMRHGSQTGSSHLLLSHPRPSSHRLRVFRTRRVRLCGWILRSRSLQMRC